jgi:hypothetical protein
MQAYRRSSFLSSFRQTFRDASMKKPSSLPPSSSEPDDEEGGLPEPNHSLDHGRKADAVYYGDDPAADPDDANLSALFAEMGVDERLDELGL